MLEFFLASEGVPLVASHELEEQLSGPWKKGNFLLGTMKEKTFAVLLSKRIGLRHVPEGE